MQKCNPLFLLYFLSLRAKPLITVWLPVRVLPGPPIELPMAYVFHEEPGEQIGFLLDQPMKKTIALAIALAISSSALAEGPYPTPKPDGIQSVGTCPTGYVGVDKFCEALHKDAPTAYPNIKDAPCPPGTFTSGYYYKAFH